MIRNNRITTIYVPSYYSDGINGPRYDINSKWRGLCQIRSIFHELKLKLITNQFRVLIVIVIRLSSRHHVCSDHCFVLFCFVMVWFCLFVCFAMFLFCLFVCFVYLFVLFICLFCYVFVLFVFVSVVFFIFFT